MKIEQTLGQMRVLITAENGDECQAVISALAKIGCYFAGEPIKEDIKLENPSDYCAITVSSKCNLSLWLTRSDYEYTRKSEDFKLRYTADDFFSSDHDSMKEKINLISSKNLRQRDAMFRARNMFKNVQANELTDEQIDLINRLQQSLS